jgi:hypothetical protein
MFRPARFSAIFMRFTWRHKLASRSHRRSWGPIWPVDIESCSVTLIFFHSELYYCHAIAWLFSEFGLVIGFTALFGRGQMQRNQNFREMSPISSRLLVSRLIGASTLRKLMFELVTKLPINPIIRTRTRYFRRACHRSRDNILTQQDA